MGPFRLSLSGLWTLGYLRLFAFVIHRHQTATTKLVTSSKLALSVSGSKHRLKPERLTKKELTILCLPQALASDLATAAARSLDLATAI